jgi:hypothetical protein
VLLIAWVSHEWSRREQSIDHHLPKLRRCESGNYADRCVPDRLSMHGLRRRSAAKARRLLRLLLLRVCALSADAGRGLASAKQRSDLLKVLHMTGMGS